MANQIIVSSVSLTDISEKKLRTIITKMPPKKTWFLVCEYAVNVLVVHNASAMLKSRNWKSCLKLVAEKNTSK